VDEPLPIAGSSPDPQLVAEQEELHTALLETINTLSPKNRSAILLFYHEQFSLQQVANRLNISVGAVKVVYTNRHQLRAIITPSRSNSTSLQEIKTMTINTSKPSQN